MLVVIAMLGLIAGIAMVTIDFSRTEAEVAAARLSRDLSLVRSRAIFEGNDFIVTFDVTNSRLTYTVHDDMNNNGSVELAIGETVETHDLGETNHNVAIAFVSGLRGVDGAALTEPVTLAGSPPRVTFSARSRANAGAIYLAPEDDLRNGDPRNMRAITISGASGKVQRWRYDPESSGPGPWRLQR